MLSLELLVYGHYGSPELSFELLFILCLLWCFLCRYYAVMFSAAAHVTPFLLMEIIVQQSIVLVRAGIYILKTIMLVRCLLWSILC